jgi:3-oxoacyl-[acyl-carrier-protein] synthase III
VTNWESERIGMVGFGHDFPGPPLPIGELPVVAAREIEPATLRRLGIDTLHHSSPQESALDLGERAAVRAIADARISPSEVDLIVVSNSSQRMYAPELGPRLAHRVGATAALGFDVCGGCAGFVLGLQTAASMLATQRWQTAVVVATEQFSRLARPVTADTLVAGDAAGAVVLRRGVEVGSGLIDSVMHSDGDEADVLTVDPDSGYLRYNHRRLFDLAVQTQVKVVEELLGRNGLALDDIDLFVPHPGSNKVITDLVNRLGVDPGKVASTFRATGNTVSAMIPTALSVHKAAGRLSPGSLVLACTAGAGWFGGGALAVV